MNYIYSWIYTAVRSDVDANIGERNLTVSSPPPSLTTGVIFYSEVVFDVFHATYRRVPRSRIDITTPEKDTEWNNLHARGRYTRECIEIRGKKNVYSLLNRSLLDIRSDPMHFSPPFLLVQIYILAAIDLITRSIAYSSSQIDSIRILYSAAFIWIKMETRVGRAIIQKSLQQANQIFERNGAIGKQIEQRSILTREIRCWNIKSKVLSISKCALHDFVRDRMNAQST